MLAIIYAKNRKWNICKYSERQTINHEKIEVKSKSTEMSLYHWFVTVAFILVWERIWSYAKYTLTCGVTLSSRNA